MRHHTDRLGVDCHHQTAMRSVCVFASILFVTYFLQMYILITHKEVVLSEVGEVVKESSYERIPLTSTDSDPSLTLTRPASLPLKSGHDNFNSDRRYRLYVFYVLIS
jgi:hypothetical protein